MSTRTGCCTPGQDLQSWRRCLEQMGDDSRARSAALRPGAKRALSGVSSNKWATGCYKTLVVTCLFSSALSCHQSSQVVNIVAKTQGTNESLREKLFWPEGDGLSSLQTAFARVCTQHRAKTPKWAGPIPLSIP